MEEMNLVALKPSFLRSNMGLIMIVLVIVIGLSLYFSTGDNNLKVEEEEEESVKVGDYPKSESPEDHDDESEVSDVQEEKSMDGADVLESFVAKHSKNSPCKPRFVETGDVGNYRLSAKVESKRGNSCLKNCSTENDLVFVNKSGDLTEGSPVAYIDTANLEYSNFNAVCSEPGEVCKDNAQVISKYSPGGLLMVEQNDNVNTTNSGLNLVSSVIQSNQVKQDSKHNGDVVEHFVTGAVELVLVVFLASWCPHCKNVKPALNRFKKLHDNKQINGVNVKVVEYDADKNKDKVKEHGVDGFPTFKLLVKNKDGEEKVVEHDGGRTYEDLVKLCKDNSQ